jgi:hypothetical protein
MDGAAARRGARGACEALPAGFLSWLRVAAATSRQGSYIARFSALISTLRDTEVLQIHTNPRRD